MRARGPRHQIAGCARRCFRFESKARGFDSPHLHSLSLSACFPLSEAKIAFRSLDKVRGAVRTTSGYGCGRTNRARSLRSISNGVMHFTPRPMQASGILIFFVDAAGTSCVTTTWFPACAWATR